MGCTQSKSTDALEDGQVESAQCAGKKEDPCKETLVIASSVAPTASAPIAPAPATGTSGQGEAHAPAHHAAHIDKLLGSLIHLPLLSPLSFIVPALSSRTI